VLSEEKHGIGSVMWRKNMG